MTNFQSRKNRWMGFKHGMTLSHTLKDSTWNSILNHAQILIIFSYPPNIGCNSFI
jgi:hypothetical protein